MKRNISLTKKMTASLLACVTALSVITCSSFTAMAAAPSKKDIVKDLTEYTADHLLSFLPGGEAVSDLLKLGSGYILGMVLDDESEEEQPSIQDVLSQLDQIDEKISAYHEEEMNKLQLINSNIDSKDFRNAADTIADDYQQAIRKMNQYSKNITTPGEGLIDETTYRTYKSITEDPTCDISKLEYNFNTMANYIKGDRTSTDRRSGYRVSSQYLMDKIVAGYKNESHDWNTSADFYQAVDSVNRELATMQADVTMDCVTILALNDMKFKIREYEIAKGIYTPSAMEDPYSYYINFTTDLTKSLSVMNDYYKQVIAENKVNHDFIQASVTLSEPVGVLQTKGFHNFYDAWAEASATGKDFTITGYQDVTADAKKSYNFDNLDKTKYGFTNTNTFLVKPGRNITVDMTEHTFDNSPAGDDIGTFGLEDNVNFTLKNANITGGSHAVYVGNRNNVCTNLENVAIQETNNSAIIYGSNTSKNMQLNMKNCSIKDTKSNSAVRIATSDANYTMEGCTFENNKGLSGGAIDCPAVNDNNKINNSTFTGNQATDGYGGALNIGKVQVSDSKFVDNQSNHWERYASKGAGGAVAAQHFIADKCTFDNNKTNDQAGAVIVWGNNIDSNVVAVTNSSFTGNSATNVGGAVRLFGMGKWPAQYIKNCSFNNNTCNDQGGRGAGVFIEISTDNFYNNLLSNWGNTGSNVCGWSMYTYLKYYSQ